MKVLIVESRTKLDSLKSLLPTWKILPVFLPSPHPSVEVEKGNWSKENFAHLGEWIDEANDEDIFLLTNPGWRGEALAFHICRNFELKLEYPRKISPASNSREEVNTALAKPEKINLNWVGAYECVRTMDKLLGFRLTPLIWKDLKSYDYLPTSRLSALILKLIADSNGVDNCTEDTLLKEVTGILLHGRAHTDALEQLAKLAYIKQDGQAWVILPKGKRYLSFLEKRVCFLLNMDFHLKMREDVLAVSEGKLSYHEVVYLFYQTLRGALKKSPLTKERRHNRALDLHLEQES